MSPLARFLRCAAIAALVAGAGCSDSVSPGKTELVANRQKWETQQLARYDFTLEMFCFCAIRGPIRVSVVNGAVVSAVELANGGPIDPTWVPSIEGLFDFVERGIADHALVLEVTYDPVMGYPRRIVYDRAANIADEEVTYQVANVVRTAAGNTAPPR